MIYFLFDKFLIFRYNLPWLFFSLGLWYISSNNQNVGIDQQHLGNRSIPLYIGTEDATKRNQMENEFYTILHLSMFFLTSCDTGKGSDIPEFIDDTSDTTPGEISDKLIAHLF